MRRPLILALLLAATPAAAAPEIRHSWPSPFAGMGPIEYRYYDIRGVTAPQIFASLSASAMRQPDGRAASGLTQWRLYFSWQEGHDPRGCKVRDARSQLSLTVILPRLADESRVPPAALAQWHRYLRTLEAHEAGHVRIAFTHADDFERATATAKCSQVKTISQTVMARVVALQADYDRRTRHGQAQQEAAD